MAQITGRLTKLNYDDLKSLFPAYHPEVLQRFLQRELHHLDVLLVSDFF